MKSLQKFSTLTVLGLTCLPLAQAQSAVQPLPSSLQSSYFIFKLASSLQLSDAQTPQCDTTLTSLRQTANVTLSHSFVLPASSASLQTTLDDYAQTYNFTPTNNWNTALPGSISRNFIAPDVHGYSYTVALAPLNDGSTALCVDMLGLE